MSDSLTALFVRVPVALADQLDQKSRQLGRSKQSVVTDMLTHELNSASPSEGTPDILDLDQVAELLDITPDDVLERIRDGGFPGRRFGTNWRFARSAVLEWMSGTDPLRDHPTGFQSRPEEVRSGLAPGR